MCVAKALTLSTVSCTCPSKQNQGYASLDKGEGIPSFAGVQAETTVQVSAAVLQRLSGLESVGGAYD